MANPHVILIGCGAQAKYALDIFSRTGQTVSHLFDPIGEKIGQRLCNITIKSAKAFQTHLLSAEGKYDDSVALICLRDNKLKAKYFKRIENRIKITDAIHPDCIISETAGLGCGIIVNAGAVIQPLSSIGNGCMIHAGVVVEHDNMIGDFVNLAPGVTLAGGVKIGEGTTVCSGAVITPNIRIGKYSVIGAGSTVLHDIPDHVLAYGSPARVIRELNK